MNELESDFRRMTEEIWKKHFSPKRKSTTPCRKRKRSSPHIDNHQQTPNASEAPASTAGTSNRSQTNEQNNSQTNKFHEILELPLLPNFTGASEKLLNLLSSKTLSKTESFELMKGYSLPGNFESVRPKILPNTITSKVQDNVRQLEELQLIAQIKLSSIIGAVLASLMTANLGLPAMHGQLADIKKKLEDIGLLAVDLQSTLTRIRRSNILPAVEPLQRNEVNCLLPIGENSKVNYDDVNSKDEKILIYMRRNLNNNESIPVKDLQLKLLFLLQLRSRKNIMTISNIKVSQIVDKDDFAEINIPDEGIKFEIHRDIEDPVACPLDALRIYITRTRPGRGEVDYLFLKNRKTGAVFERSGPQILERSLKDFKYESAQWVKRNLTGELK